LRLLRANEVFDAIEPSVEYAAIQKQQRAQRLVLCRRGDVAVNRQMCEELVDFGLARSSGDGSTTANADAAEGNSRSEAIAIAKDRGRAESTTAASGFRGGRADARVVSIAEDDGISRGRAQAEAWDDSRSESAAIVTARQWGVSRGLSEARGKGPGTVDAYTEVQSIGGRAVGKSVAEGTSSPNGYVRNRSTLTVATKGGTAHGLVRTFTKAHDDSEADAEGVGVVFAGEGQRAAADVKAESSSRRGRRTDFKLTVSYTDTRGRTQSPVMRGTADQIRQQAGTLPDPVRARVEYHLRQASGDATAEQPIRAVVGWLGRVFEPPAKSCQNAIATCWGLEDSTPATRKPSRDKPLGKGVCLWVHFPACD
jgi:hypothetical protein